MVVLDPRLWYMKEIHESVADLVLVYMPRR